MRGEGSYIGPDGLRDVSSRNCIAVPQAGAFHLVEDGVVGAVDGIAAVDVCADEEAGAFVCGEDVGLVGGGVGSEDGVFVDVVGVCFVASRVVGGEA